MQRGEYDLQCRLTREFRVGIDRNAATIVGNDQLPIRRQSDLDAGGVACNRFIHGVVEHLGGEVMQRPLVGPADIHARAATDRFQPFEDFDIDGIIFRGSRRSGKQIRHGRVIGPHPGTCKDRAVRGSSDESPGCREPY